MNVKLLSIKDLNNNDVVWSDILFILYNDIGYIDSLTVGEIMVLKDNDACCVHHRSSTIQSVTYSEDKKTVEILTLDYKYIFKILDDGKKRTPKASLYTHIKFKNRLRKDTRNPDGYLYAYGRYPTKIFPSDLPDWYVYGYMYKTHGFMSAKGVKHLHFKPNYTADNHLYKYDTLFISYDSPITPTNSFGFEWFEGYRYILDGPTMLDFIDAAEKYSSYDVSEIRKELEKKKVWYYERNPKH